jgi:cytochrome c-type biogenesis protein CcmH
MKLPDKVARLFLALVLILVSGAALAQEPFDEDAAIEQAPDPRFIVGEPEGRPLAGDELETRTVQVSSLLRCPTCQGLSINDSPARMARAMKEQTRELLAQGYSGEQVMTYFEKAYGEFVRLEPPRRGINWLVWLSPVAFLIVGFFVVRRVVGKMSAPKPAMTEEPGAGVPDRNRLPDDEELARYVLRARELAYGWPGGVAPKSETEAR